MVPNLPWSTLLAAILSSPKSEMDVNWEPVLDGSRVWGVSSWAGGFTDNVLSQQRERICCWLKMDVTMGITPEPLGWLGG